MDPLKIEATISSPSVAFDPETGDMEIGGESYPENSFEFYAPIESWLHQYLETSSRRVRMRVTLSYLNTSSTKCMIDLLDELEAAHSRGIEVTVEWYYDPDNERARDNIEEFREDYTMPFHIKPAGGSHEP